MTASKQPWHGRTVPYMDPQWLWQYAQNLSKLKQDENPRMDLGEVSLYLRSYWQLIGTLAFFRNVELLLGWPHPRGRPYIQEFTAIYIYWTGYVLKKTTSNCMCWEMGWIWEDSWDRRWVWSNYIVQNSIRTSKNEEEKIKIKISVIQNI